MADKFYTKGANKLWLAGINWQSDVIEALFVSAAYAPDFANDEFASVIGGNIVGRTGALANCTVTNGGKLSHDDVVVSGIADGAANIDAVVYIKKVTNDANSPLLIYRDNANTLVLDPNGENITLKAPNFVYEQGL